ncbi:hypothetical protein V6U90_21990 [Micromonospora sp. CPCC 206060]
MLSALAVVVSRHTALRALLHLPLPVRSAAPCPVLFSIPKGASYCLS